MDVTAVIPVYNRQSGGERALRSVLAQTVVPAEILIVDDASDIPFHLPADLVSHSRIRLIRHDLNRGESGARNTAIAAAQHDWIAFLDSDDFWLSTKLEKQIAFARSDQENKPNDLTCYVTGFVQIHLNGKRYRAMIPEGSRDPSDFASGCWFMQGSTVLMSRAAAIAAGPCDERLRRLQDLDWFLRFALVGGEVKVAPVVASVIEIGSHPDPDAVARACAHITSKWIEPDAERRLPHPLRRKLRAYLDVERASANYYSGNYPATAAYLARSFVLVPRRQISLKSWWRGVGIDEAVAREIGNLRSR